MRTGRRNPTLRICEPYEKTYGSECAEFCEAGGLHLLPWQRDILNDWLAIGPDGYWLNNTIGTEVNRQNGKSEGLLVARVGYGLVVLGERIIFTSHRQDAATEFYRVLTQLLGSNAYRNFVDPEFFKGALGREEVPVKDGNTVSFVARSNKGGRSKHSDLLIIDEAQFLTDAELASLIPTQLTSENMVSIYTGTMPAVGADGYVFRDTREKAIAGNRGIYWAEWSVGEKMPKDVGDRNLWYKTNPSLGLLIPERNMEALYNTLPADKFANECLGWLPPRSGNAEPPAIDPEQWKNCEVTKAPAADDERIACGVKFSADGSTYSVSMAARSKDAPVLIECVDRTGTSHGVSGLASWLYDRRDRLALVCIDGREWTPTLMQRLDDMGYPKRGVHVMRTRELTDACAMLANAIAGRTVVHIDQPLLTDSVNGSPRRAIGRDGWAFGGNDPTPIESCALAHWGVTTTKRNPQRKMRVGI